MGGWKLQYTSCCKILLVGEGDFSFACCLADEFGSGANMVATSLDSRAELLAQYSKAAENVARLESYGCTIIHEVNARTMSDHPLLFLESFDFIIFNFPHAGFNIFGGTYEHSPEQIEVHRELVRGFLRSARNMLGEKGEVHITHKTAHPYNRWNVVELAEAVGLGLVRTRPFYIWEFPGYGNKRGSGKFCDEAFPVGVATTYMFTKINSIDQQ